MSWSRLLGLLGSLCLFSLGSSAEVLVHWTSAPNTVSSGQNYFIEARGYIRDNNDVSMGHVFIFKRGAPFVEGYPSGNSSEVWAGLWSSDHGAQEIEYTAEAADEWGYTSGYIYHTVRVIVPNRAPGIEWALPMPTTIKVNQQIRVQAHGWDPDGNLQYVFVTLDGGAFASNYGGNGYDSWGDANTFVSSNTRPVVFTAVAIDTHGVRSATIQHTIYIENDIPGIYWTQVPTAFTYVNSLFTLKAHGGDRNGNLESTRLYADIEGVGNFIGLVEGGGGNGYDVDLTTTMKVPGPPMRRVTCVGIAGDSLNAQSALIFHNFTSLNRVPALPELTWTETTIAVGQSMIISSYGTDADENETFHYLYTLSPSAARDDWKEVRKGEYPLGTGRSLINYTFVPTEAGIWKIKTRTNDPHAPSPELIVNVVVNPPPDTTPPNPQTGLTAGQPWIGSVPFSWTVSNSGDVSRQRIFWSPTSGGAESNTEFGNQVIKVSIDTLAPGTEYRFYMRAVDASGNVSVPSNEVKVSTLALAGDADNDQIPNKWEIDWGLDPYNSADALQDPDGDGLSSFAEYAFGSNPNFYNTSPSGSLPAGWATLVAPSTSTDAVGVTTGQLNVDQNGAATYTIPIAVTPGTAGMEPKLSLNYSSQGGAGIAGFGWSLGGLSSISRGPQTPLIDTKTRGVSFTADDRFYLDGQRLILISGTYGSPGSEYRTEIDSFSRIVAYGAAGSGPSWFRVWTKAGLIMEYGRTEDARFQPYRLEGTAFVSKAEALNWGLGRVYDTSGNYMEFVYEESEAAGTQRLARINYTGHQGTSQLPYASMRFEYEDRGDTTKGYTAGAMVAATKRLKAIRAYYGETVLRTYSLSYISRPTTNRSILASLVETGSDGKKLPPLSFEYSNPALGWDYLAEAWAPPTPLVKHDGNTVKTRGTGFVDVNSDGLPDFVQYLYTGASSVGRAWLNKPAGWEPANQFRPPWPLGWDNGADQRSDGGSRWVDLNGDGRIDFIASNNVDNLAYINNGAGFTPTPAWNPPVRLAHNEKPDIGRRLLDVNGDGLVDILYYYKWFETNGSIQVPREEKGAYLNTGSGWVLSADYTPKLPIYAGSISSMFLDVNGDGLPDQVMHTVDGTPVRGVVLNTGAMVGPGWNQLVEGTAEFNRYVPPVPFNGILNGKSTTVGAEFVDLNGDGLIDLVKRYQSDSRAYINTGGGWIWAPSYLAPHEIMNNWEGRGIAFLDVNNDGSSDFVRAWWNWDPVHAIHLNTPTGWGGAEPGYQLLRQIAQPNRFNTGADFIDINGDGAVDQVWNYENDASKAATKNRRVNPDRLIKVTNGFGVKVELSFKPLTDSTVYTKGTDLSGITDTGKVANLVVPTHVVSQVRHDDGAGGTYDINYAYAGLRAHRERGSLGFAMMQVTDSRTDIISKTWFNQNYPYVGMTSASETRKPGGGVLSETVITYATKSLHTGKTRFPYVSETIQRGFELNGTLVTESVTLAQYDDWGNATRLEVGAANDHDKVTVSTYDNLVQAPSDTTLNGWLLGRLRKSTVTATAPSLPTQTRVSSFEYDATTGLLKKEIVEPDRATDAANYTLTTEYAYDAFGNKKSATTSGGGVAARTVSTEFDTRGRFPKTTTNALLHTESYVYDSGLGVLTSTTGPNGLTTSWLYDGFGRKTKETRADGTVTSIRQNWCGTGAPAGSKYLVETESTGSAPSAVFYDSFGRSIYSYGINGGGLDGKPRIVGVLTEYDSRGRAVRTSQPFYQGDTPKTAAETTSFDLLDRPLEVRTADEDVTGGWAYSSVEYAGLTTKATNPKSQRTETTKNQLGQVVRVVTNAGAATTSAEYGEVKYTYDVYGNLITTSVRRQTGTYVTTTLTYDLRGRKVGMSDPDMGNWTYTYNAAGELISQVDPKAKTVTMKYDLLGRLIERSEAEGLTTWIYDTATGKGIGQLQSVASPGGYTETYAYDTLGRPTSISRVVETGTYTTRQDYDATTGRPTVTTYPSGFKVANVYTSLGFLEEVREAGGRTNFLNEVIAGQVFWRADRYSLTGQLDGSRLGNGLTYDRVISTSTGRTKAITSGLLGGTTVQYHAYTYDVLGNVSRRIDHATGRDESFTYDGLNRLTNHSVVGGAAVGVTYDSLGNIASKSDLGSYTYGGSRPHAVTAAGTRSLSYDNNGNVISDGTRTFEWTSFNQIKKMTQGAVNTQFSFGAGHERVVQQHSNGTKTIYIGTLYEKVTATGGFVEDKHYIYTPLGRTAVRTVRNDGTVETRYLHQDGLGSVCAVTDERARIEKRFTFDAWGKRVKTADTHAARGGTVTRGYTDHEHLEDFGLIHMNGRVYDPVLGRFLSADPFIGDATDSQEFNRYSYVSNNPLGATDPSGYFKLSFKQIVIIAAVVVLSVVTAGAAAAAYGGVVASTLGVSSAVGAGIVGGAVGGFVSGFAGSLLNGGSIGDAFKSGVIGGIAGAITGGIAGKIGNVFGDVSKGSFGNEFGRALAHGAVGGAAEEIQGGSFRHGFYAGFAGSAAGSVVGQSGLQGMEGNAGVATRTAIVATAGGTASALGGGKFANGAITAAFQHLFNAEAHRDEYTFWDGVKDATSGALQGAAAFVDGVIPFADPLQNQLKLYDSNQYGLNYSQSIGGYTRDAVLAVATAGGTVEAQTAARIGLKVAEQNAVKNNVFRWGVGSFKNKGVWLRDKLHFHIGPGPGPMTHHLPYQAQTWRHHAAATIRNWWNRP